jgi:hypothetical protein
LSAAFFGTAAASLPCRQHLEGSPAERGGATGVSDVVRRGSLFCDCPRGDYSRPGDQINPSAPHWHGPWHPLTGRSRRPGGVVSAAHGDAARLVRAKGEL